VTAREARCTRRRAWLERALTATAGRDLIFADPDNGIRPAQHPVPAYRTKAVKHAYLDELAAFARRGQSLIVYHHADRTAAVEQQAISRLCELTREVPVEAIAAVRASKELPVYWPAACRPKAETPAPLSRATCAQNV